MRIHGRKIGEWPRFLCERPAGAGAGPGSEQKIDRLLLDQLAEIPEVRRELVAAFRLAIEENRYYVPEEQVAERMICGCLVDGMH